MDLAEVARARVEIRHVRGASDATYLINAFGEELLMQLQLNVHRLVGVYRVPALDALDASTLAVRLCQSPANFHGVSEEVKGVITGGLLVVSDHRIDTGSKSFHGEGLDH